MYGILIILVAQTAALSGTVSQSKATYLYAAWFQYNKLDQSTDSEYKDNKVTATDTDRGRAGRVSAVA